MPKPSSLVVIGLGAFGRALARNASENGVQVLAIDRVKDRVDRFADVVHNTRQADARFSKAMRECALDDHDLVVVAIATDVESSVLAVENAMQLGAKRIFAKASSDSHASILEKMGVERVIRAEEDAGRALAKQLTAQG